MEISTKFEVEDKVKVINNGIFGSKIKVGDIGRIKEVYGWGVIIDFNGREQCIFTDLTPLKYIKLIPKQKLIFRDNATILIQDGKEYIAKCEACDTYDREKGLLLCIAKANGVNYSNLQEMLSEAEVQNNKVKEVKRLAKVGEYVKVVNSNGSPVNEYKNGNILKIVKVEDHIFGSIAYYKNAESKYLYEDEYVVLENYK